MSTFTGDIYRVNTNDNCSLDFFAHCPYEFNDIAVDVTGRLFLTANDSLLTMDAANPLTGCIFVGRFIHDIPNALEFASNGKLYAAGNTLQEYDPVTNKITLLGNLPLNVYAGGDLVSYNNKLYLSTTEGDLYDIDITDPEKSKLYYKVNLPRLFGMTVMPVKCFNDPTDKLRVFAFELTGPNSSVAYMIDMEAKTTYPNFCRVNTGVTGATSFHPPVINGKEINIPGFTVSPATCKSSSDGSIHILTVPGSSENYFYSVNDIPGSPEPNIQNLGSGDYTLHTRNQYGCYKDTLVTIPYKTGNCIDSIFVPNAFSPNQDKLNDIFKPQSFVPITNYHMQVYNRMGQQIFESRDLRNGWDGTFKGILQTPGAYVWQLHYTNFKGSPVTLKGFVLLLK